MNTFDEQWDSLAGLLRQEIEGYGRLFGLLEEQRASFLGHDLEGIIQTNGAMEEQTEHLEGVRRERESLVTGIWQRSGGSGPEATVKALIAFCPDETGPLFQELLNEVNRLIGQSRQRLEQNQMLMRRYREIGQKFLHLVHPESASTHTVYAANGRYPRAAASAPLSRYQAQA